MLKEYKISDIENIKIHGRTTGKKDPLSLLWTASGIEMNYKGSALRIRYKADYNVFEPWISVIVNGVRYQKRPLEKGVHEITIWNSTETAAGMEAPERNIRIIRDTPAMPGDQKTMIQIEAIFADGTFEEIGEPAMRIEFIGDSITSGEGGIGPHDEMDWNSSCFDVVDNYAYMTASALKADYNVYSQSGWGFCWSWYGNPMERMPLYYEQICGIVPGDMAKDNGFHEKWDFNGFRPDVVVVNLGTNDVGAYTDNGHLNAEQMNFNNDHNRDEKGFIPAKDIEFLKKSAVNFITLIREKNPNAKIIWAYGMLGQEAEHIDQQMREILSGAVEEYVAKSGDTNAYYVQLQATEGDGFGSRSHPGHKSHKNASERLVKKIKELGF